MTRCAGVSRLTARLEPWQEELCADAGRLADALAEHGSPVNVIDPGPMKRNASELMAAAQSAGVELELYFARKANKSLALVDEARRMGLGVDLASEAELRQCVARGVPGSALMMTAAVKPRGLLELCAAEGVTVAVDNRDELAALRAVAADRGLSARVALRLAPSVAPRTRFGMPSADLVEVAGSPDPAIDIRGVHFHVDGYAAADRIEAIDETLVLIDALRGAGHRPGFIDIGGGIPMRYLDAPAQWDAFWDADRGTLTYDGHELGPVYPVWQEPVRGEWLTQVLDGRSSGASVASRLRERDLTLRAEPGRALLDGTGLTAARVEFRKQRADGTWLMGLAMNRTQCRSAADDFLVDPLLISPDGGRRDATDASEGYLVGAYCIERELLTWRRLRFPDGVAVGDIVVFPNTAGYFMHILESASHQIPLARNLIRSADGTLALDPIDGPPAR